MNTAYSLSPTAVRVVGLDPEFETMLQNLARLGNQGLLGPGDTPGQMIALLNHINSQNLLDVYNTNATNSLALQKLRNDYKELESKTADDTADLRRKVRKLKAEKSRLEKALDTAQATQGTNTSTPGVGKLQEMTAPEKFSGDRAKYRMFKTQMEAKLLGDSHKFKDEQHKMLYMTSLLQGNAYDMILPYIKRDGVDLEDHQELWDVLDGAYDDPDRKGTAERELNNLKQANRGFSQYFSDFQRIMGELQWDNSAKRAALYKGLSEELKDLLVNYDLPDNWTAYHQLLLRLDCKLAQRAAEKRPKGSSAPAIKTTPARAPVIPVSERTTANPNYHGPAPMDLSAAAKEAERQRRYNERRSAGLCTFCGDGGHFRAECPRRRNNPVRAAEAALAPADIPAPAESGNV